MISLAQASDGRLVMASSQPFPADVRHIEYYREQRLFCFVYDTEDEQSALMPCEISPETAAIVQASPNVIVVVMAEPGTEPYGYTVSLVQIGV